MSTTDEQILEMMNDLEGLFEQADGASAALDEIFEPLETKTAIKRAVASLLADLQEGSVDSLLSVKERVGALLDDLIARQLAR
jgi:hypothetical protein